MLRGRWTRRGRQANEDISARFSGCLRTRDRIARLGAAQELGKLGDKRLEGFDP